MKITVALTDITTVDTPALIVNLFKGVKTPGGATGAVDKALDGGISSLIDDGEITGKKGEMTLLHTNGQDRTRSGGGGRPRIPGRLRC